MITRKLRRFNDAGRHASLAYCLRCVLRPSILPPSARPCRDRCACARFRSASCFGFLAARMQNPFGITVGLRAALENQIARCLERNAVNVWRHRPI